MVKSQTGLLTDLELEVMNLLWSIGGGSVRDVLQEFPEERSLAYTTVSTVLRILEKKNFVKAIKDKKKHLYMPCLEKGDYQKRSVTNLVEKVFDCDSFSLARKLVESSSMTKSEWDDLKKMIDDEMRS